MSKPANVICDPVTGVCRYVPDATDVAPDTVAEVPTVKESASALEGLLGSTLKSKTGAASVSSVTGQSKVIGLYFSAHWCPPCRGFTPVLAEFYKKFKASHPRKDDLEIIFVSSDRDEKSFESYFAEMPWLALPYEDRDRKASLSKKFKVQGIPSLVFLDGQTGNTITTAGRAKVASDPEAADFPWIPQPFHEIVAGDLIDAQGNTVQGSDVLKGKITLVYFSAHWCPPCKMFTPKLAETYNTLKAAGKNVEAVFVSWDKEEESFKHYLETMPWLAVPYTNQKVRDTLGEMYPVDGIPTLIIIDEDGKTINTRGREAVLDDREGVNFPWKPQPFEPLTGSNISIVNETAMLLLVGSGDVKSRATELLESVAVAHKASDRAEDLFFAYGSPDDDVVQSLVKFADVTLAADKDTLVIVDIPDQSKYVFDGSELTAAVVADIVQKQLKQNLPTKPLRDD